MMLCLAVTSIRAAFSSKVAVVTLTLRPGVLQTRSDCHWCPDVKIRPSPAELLVEPFDDSLSSPPLFHVVLRNILVGLVAAGQISGGPEEDRGVMSNVELAAECYLHGPASVLRP